MPPRVFGEFRIDEATGRVLKDGRPVPLTPKAYAVLQYLVDRPGRLVTKADLLAAVWPDVFVGDAVLKSAVREIRRALGDDAVTPRFIETAHRRGYRFIADVQPLAESDTVPHSVAPRVRYARSGHVNIAYQSARQRPASPPVTDSVVWLCHRRGPPRPRLRDGLGISPRVLLERAVVRAIPPAPVVVRPGDPLRQTRHGSVGRESQRLPARIWQATFAEFQRTDLLRPLGGVKAPTLIVWGDRDSVVTRGDTDRLRASLPHARLLVYEGAGHGFHWEDSARFARDLVEFVTGDLARSGSRPGGERR